MSKRLSVASSLAGLALLSAIQGLAAPAPVLRLMPVSVGKNLEAYATVALDEAAPEGGLVITVTSSDPARMVLSPRPDTAGTDSITLTVRARYRESPEFWIQSNSDAGDVQLMAASPGCSAGAAAVTLTPSAMILVGPFQSPRFQTTSGADPVKLSLVSVRLDQKLRVAEEQAISGGRPVSIAVSSSKPAVGVVEPEASEIKPGASSARILFRPAGEGETVLTPKRCCEAGTPLEIALLRAVVVRPGLAISDQLSIGKNLQVAGVLSLGQAAGADGISVTLTSNSPDQLLLSASANEPGSASIQVSIPADEASGRFYIQALGGSGSVEYTASAAGYRSRTATVYLTPSGILLTPVAQGPPDEAQVLRKEAPDGTHRVSVSVSNPAWSRLMVWTAQLDPVTRRGADINVQPLRAGVGNIQIALHNSNPSVGTVASVVSLEGGLDHGTVEFLPKIPGRAEISVEPPDGFMPSANSTLVIVTVKE